MGQYMLLVNLTKKEFVHPHKLGCGLKWWEQVCSRIGTAPALLCLIGPPVRRGGGDLDFKNEDVAKVAGRWHGDQVALIGDYAEDTDLGSKSQDPASQIYDLCHGDQSTYTDISEEVAKCLEVVIGGVYSGSGWKDFELDNDNGVTNHRPCDCCRKEQEKFVKAKRKVKEGDLVESIVDQLADDD